LPREALATCARLPLFKASETFSTKEGVILMRNRILLIGLAGLVGQAFAGGVFFSEYIEGSSNNKALEIYNGTDAAIDMANYATWRISNGGDWAEGQTNAVEFGSLTTELLTDLIVDPGETFVIANSSWDMTNMPITVDVLGTSACFYNGDDAMGLAVTADGGATWTLIDAVGEEGPDVGTNWPVGSGATSEYTLVRMLTVCEGTTDWTVGATQWDVYPQNTTTYLGSHTVDCAGNQPPYITNVEFTPSATPVAPGAMLTFSITSVDDDGSVVGAVLNYGTDAGNLSSQIVLDGDGSTWTNLTPVVAPGACETLYYEFVVTDDAGDTGSNVGSLAVECSVSIYDIQGQTADSPYVGTTVGTSGIITAVAYNGFYLQDGDGAWNGVWVYAGTGNTAGFAAGDAATCVGSVVEYYNLTELDVTGGSVTVTSTGNALPNPVALSTAAVNDEAYEGVLVSISDAFAGATGGYGEYPMDDGSGVVVMDDQIVAYDFPIEEGECYNVTGPVNYSFGAFKISPDAGGVVPCGGFVDANELVHAFELGQAYPNPFNPSTTINFSLEMTAEARLSVYNLAGQEVAVLAQGMMDAGRHQVTFDASSLSSGMYIYRLESEGQSLAGRMMLIK
jgi:hypothetical protein